jgi:hypothetical protein
MRSRMAGLLLEDAFVCKAAFVVIRRIYRNSPHSQQFAGQANSSRLFPVSEVPDILNAIGAGDAQAASALLPLVYAELRKLAAAQLAREKPGQTLQATGLVHEAYVRLVGVDHAKRWNSRGHFFAAAAEAMRRILIGCRKGVRNRIAIWFLTPFPL